MTTSLPTILISLPIPLVPKTRSRQEQQLQQTVYKRMQVFAFGISKPSYNPSSNNLLRTTSLKRLMESISRSEEEERAEIVEVTNKLRQFKYRQRQCNELLEHITSFLQEEKGNSNVKGATSAPMKSKSSSYHPSHSHFSSEKRCSVILKCLTTQAVHIELLNLMDVDAFLLAL